jgi:hypothetical protein
MNETSLDSIELHDALIKSLSVDFESEVVRVEIEFYPDSETAQRVSAVLVFEGVTSVSNILDLARTRSGRIAGNVNYWVPNEVGTTYLYLVDGCVAVTAKAVRFVRKGL